MTRIKKRKCRNCGQFFLPDYRNAKRQHYCPKPECRNASKTESPRKWLNKPENKDYFTGPAHVKRVQQWRKRHPGYWRKKSNPENELQDPCRENHIEKQSVDSTFMKSALQDPCISQVSVLIGLIAQFTGSALQNDIANTVLGQSLRARTEASSFFASNRAWEISITMMRCGPGQCA